MSSFQVAGRGAVQNSASDANTQPIDGEQPSETSPGLNRDAMQPTENAGLPRGQLGEQAREPANPTLVIRGIVTGVPNVATWVVGGRTVRLFGINPGPPKLLASLVNWVRTKGPVECLPQARTLRYRCFTATGEDIAEAALLAGVGRAGERAPAAYENAEFDARQMGKGLWARR